MSSRVRSVTREGTIEVEFPHSFLLLTAAVAVA